MLQKALTEIEEIKSRLSDVPPSETPQDCDDDSSSKNKKAGASSRDIDGQGYVKEAGVIAYIKNKNPSVKPDTLTNLIKTYFVEAKDEKINVDIAIAQMLYATDYLSNHRMATRNYAGLSTEDAKWNGKPWDGTFPDMPTGVRAHIQHLKGYTSRHLKGDCVDPRYQILEDMGYLGSIKRFDQLYSRWSPRNPEYGRSIEGILAELYRSTDLHR